MCRELRSQIERDADLAYPLETGGILVGYVAASGEPVVHAVIGAGPKARHAPARFEPDHVWQCEQLDSLFTRSSGQWVYLGDWHTHPDGQPKMSRLDRRTLRRIAEHPEVSITRPLMLIVAGRPSAWRSEIYRCTLDVGWFPRFSIDVLRGREF